MPVEKFLFLWGLCPKTVGPAVLVLSEAVLARVIGTLEPFPFNR